MKKYYVYKITNEATGWVYIGKTSDKPLTRWRSHISSMRRGMHPVGRMTYDLRKHGLQSFIFEVLKIFETPDEMADYEKAAIKDQSGRGNCYNLFGNSNGASKDNSAIRSAMLLQIIQERKGNRS